MRNLTKFASIGALAVALTACGGKGKGTENPNGGGGGGGGGGGSANPAEASKEAKADFMAAVKTYKAAMSDGKLSGDECERVSGEFQKVYKTHGVQMALSQFNSGVVWEECGQTDKAEAIYAQLVAQAPKFDLPYNNLGVIYWKKGQESKALDMFKKGVEANKLGARAARNNVAGLVRGQYIKNTDVNSFNEVEKLIQTVLALDSGNQAAYENLARIYYDRGHRKDKSYLVLANLVVTQGTRVLKDQGRKSADLFNIQGLLLLEREDQVNALKAFKGAVGIEPNHVEANLNIGFISIRFRDYATAEKSFKIALKDARQAKNPEAHLALGVAQRGLKKFKEAEKSYNTALKLNASDPRPLYNLGVLYQDHIGTQDDIDTTEKSEKMITIAKGHYLKFMEAAKSDKQWAQQVLMAKDRVATIEQTFVFNKEAKELMKKAKEMEALQKKQDEEERKRLLELEKQAEAAEAAEAAGAAAPAN